LTLYLPFQSLSFSLLSPPPPPIPSFPLTRRLPPTPPSIRFPSLGFKKPIPAGAAGATSAAWRHADAPGHQSNGLCWARDSRKAVLRNRGTMAEINCVLTRLEVFEEDLNLPLELAAKKRQMVQRSVEMAPSAFVTGSIHQVNEKLQNLRGTIQAHPAPLLVETRVRDGALPPRMHSEKITQDFFEVQEEKKPKSKHSDVKPKLLELQHYPGFNATQSTPLPNETALDQILNNVAKARGQLKKRMGYVAEFCQMLSSSQMKDILLDIFWWFFLYMQQTHSSVQCLLFDRISKNYVQLIMKSWSWAHGDRFLQELPSTLSQAVYTSFCWSFPQSWNHFHNDNFKAKVCNIMYRWFAGIRPTPKIYNNWNYDALLPQKVIDMILRTLQDGDKIRKHSTERKQSTMPRLSLSLPLKQRNQNEPTSDLLKAETFEDFEETAMSSDTTQSVSRTTVKSSGLNRIPLPKEPPVARQGPNFMRNLFNLFGLSPLVLNFLQNLKLDTWTGENIFVTRTEIRHLPPDDAPTYHEVIEAGYRNLLKLKEMKRKLAAVQKVRDVTH
ncbi:protein FAM227A-like, partial [Narcine bancroftii]|uniref:protein FAM227A-like n=1 Tax=Narcine bancroftii TaxID=1343680 RepID=UPI0038317F4F